MISTESDKVSSEFFEQTENKGDKDMLPIIVTEPVEASTNNTIEASTNNTMVIVVTITVFFIIILIIYWFLKSKKKQSKTKESPDIQLKYGIKKKLEKIEKDLFSQHLCYKIIEESYEQELDSKSVKELKLKYPDFLKIPVINWNKEFGYLNNKIFLQNEVIKEFLQNKNYPIDNEFALNANFEHYLRDKAHKKAREIVDNYLKNGGLN